jgi:hypothetical protein
MLEGDPGDPSGGYGGYGGYGGGGYGDGGFGAGGFGGYGDGGFSGGGYGGGVVSGGYGGGGYGDGGYSGGGYSGGYSGGGYGDGGYDGGGGYSGGSTLGDGGFGGYGGYAGGQDGGFGGPGGYASGGPGMGLGGLGSLGGAMGGLAGPGPVGGFQGNSDPYGGGGYDGGYGGDFGSGYGGSVSGAFNDMNNGIGVGQSNFADTMTPGAESPREMTYGADAIEGFPQGTMASLIGNIEDPSWDPNARPIGRDGRPMSSAVGLTQMTTGAQRAAGVTDPTDPAQSIFGGANYLGQQQLAQGGDLRAGLGSYYAGAGNFDRQGFNYKGPGNQPTAGQYADRVMNGIPGAGQSASVGAPGNQFAGPGVPSGAPSNWPGQAQDIPSPLNSGAILNAKPEEGEGDGEYNGFQGIQPGISAPASITPQEAPSTTAPDTGWGSLVPGWASAGYNAAKKQVENVAPMIQQGYQHPELTQMMAGLLSGGPMPTPSNGGKGDMFSILQNQKRPQNLFAAAEARRRKMADNLENWDVNFTPA